MSRSWCPRCCMQGLGRECPPYSWHGEGPNSTCICGRRGGKPAARLGEDRSGRLGYRGLLGLFVYTGGLKRTEGCVECSRGEEIRRPGRQKGGRTRTHLLKLLNDTGVVGCLRFLVPLVNDAALQGGIRLLLGIADGQRQAGRLRAGSAASGRVLIRIQQHANQSSVLLSNHVASTAHHKPVNKLEHLLGQCQAREVGRGLENVASRIYA